MTKPEEPLSSPEYLREPQLSQEDRELLDSLPRENGWIDHYIHQYQGFWLTTRQLKNFFIFQKHFQAKETDTLLVTFPKSGTTWLKAIVFTLMYRARYPDFDQHPLLTSNPHALIPFVDQPFAYEPFPDFSNLEPPRVFSTHLPYAFLPKSVEESGCKIVYLCRNPKDTFVSLWHFANKLKPKDRAETSLEENLDKFCRGLAAFGPFWDHILSYWRKRLEIPQRMLFLHYEDLKKEPKTQLRRLSEFLDCPFSEEEESSGMMEDILKLCSFDNLSNLEVNKSEQVPSWGVMNEAFFRCGQVGDAMNCLTTEMLEQIDRITTEKFQGSGLELNKF